MNTVGLGHRTTDPTAPTATGVNSQTAVAGQTYPHGTNTIGGTDTSGVNTHESTFGKVKDAVLPGQHSHGHTGHGHAGISDSTYNTQGVNTHSGIGQTGTTGIVHSGIGDSAYNTHGVNTHESTFEKVKDAVTPGQHSHADTGHGQSGIGGVGHAHDGQHAHTGHRDASLLEKAKDAITPGQQGHAHTGGIRTHEAGYAGAGATGGLGAVAGSHEIGHHRHGGDTLPPTGYGTTGVTGLGTGTTHTITGATTGVGHPTMMEKLKDSVQVKTFK